MRRHGVFAGVAVLLVVVIVALLSLAPGGDDGSRFHVPQVQPAN